MGAFDPTHGMQPLRNERPAVTFQQSYDLTYQNVPQKAVVIPMVPGTESIILCAFALNSGAAGTSIDAFLYLDNANAIPFGQLLGFNGMYCKPIPVAQKGSKLIIEPYGNSNVGVLQVTLVRGMLVPNMVAGLGG